MLTPLEGIQQSVADLTDTTNQLSRAQASQLKKFRGVLIGAAAVLVALVVLLTVSIVLVIRSNNQQHSIKVLQDKITTESFCTLYDLFLDAIDPKATSAPGYTPEQYEAGVRVFEQGATVLGCAHHTRGPG